MRAWEEFLAKQDQLLGRETVDKWLRPLKIVRFDACNLYLEAGDSFKALWFEEHMRVHVQKHLYNNNQKQIKVHISIANRKEGESPAKSTKKSAPPSAIAPSFVCVLMRSILKRPSNIFLLRRIIF